MNKDKEINEEVNEKEAIKTGFVLINAKWDGNNEFEKGMKLLQQEIYKQIKTKC